THEFTNTARYFVGDFGQRAVGIVRIGPVEARRTAHRTLWHLTCNRCRLHPERSSTLGSSLPLGRRHSAVLVVAPITGRRWRGLLWCSRRLRQRLRGS